MANVTKHNRRSVSRLDNSFGKYAPEVTARPVDTFVRHQAPENVGGEYLALAQSLSGVAPHLTSLLKKRQEEQAALDEARGQKLFHENGGKRLSWEDYRKSVPTLPGLNDSVRNGYLRARMANEANMFREALNRAYASGDATVELPDGQKISIAESDDPVVFNLWLNRFTQSYIQDNLGETADPEYFVKEFLPQVEAAGQELGSKHVTERNHILWSRNIAEHTKLISGALGTVVRDGGVSLDEGSMSSVSGYISKLARTMMTTGVPSRTVQEAITNALIVAARNPELEDGEEFLELAHHITLEDGRTLWDTGNSALLLTNAAEEVRKERYYRNTEKRREEKEQEEQERIALGNTIADYVLSGKNPPKEAVEAYRRTHSVEDLSRLTSALRNIREGYQDRSRGGGSGESKALKAFADSVKTHYLRKHAMGEDISIDDVLKDPNVAALKYSDQKAILGMFMKDTQESRDLLKDMVSGNKDIVDAELGYLSKDAPEDAGKVSYLKDHAYKLAANEVNLLLHDHPQFPVTDPEKFRDMVRDFHREAARLVKENKDALINEGYEGDIAASDPEAINKSIGSQKQKKADQAIASSKANQSLAEELMRRGINLNWQMSR